ncbi:single-stranded-DNA-specific exonuclease RecJ, partial [Candidatus Poribacteria bacterium]|nr:single-stranded-DNA-specific exonuclease RecJ [Candidatus Poribacteria bacterium]
SAVRVEELATQGVRLLITVDTGISAAEQIRRASELGMEVVVTDHHLAEGPLPAAAAVVNPNRPDVRYAGGRLCGVGVAFKFAHALLKGAGCEPVASREFLRGLLDLVALGTIADVVPLLDENRVFAHFGLEALAASRRPGIRALLEQANHGGKTITAETVGFVLGPRLNAAGRTEHAGPALELLLTEDAARAVELARYLEMLNRRRRTEETQILGSSVTSAEQQMDSGEDSALVVAGEEFHLGVVGIVAARLVERFYRPAIVLRLDREIARGSARSIPGFDIHEALQACGDHLVGFGGHAAAAGLKLRPDSITPFRTAINGFASNAFKQKNLTQVVEIDARVEPPEFGWDLLRDTQRLRPFGQENAAPVYLLEGVSNAADPRIVGTNHLKMRLSVNGEQFGAIGFNLGHLLPLCESRASRCNVLFRPSENQWQGRTSLELEIIDLQPA